MIRFTTKQQALEAGYRNASQSVSDLFTPHPHLKATIIDTSGPNSKGYSFSIVAYLKMGAYEPDLENGQYSPERLAPLQAYSAIGHHRICSTDTVKLTEELNNIKQPGAFSPMFSPAALEAGTKAWEAVKQQFDNALASIIKEQRPKTLSESIDLAISRFEKDGLAAQDTLCEHEGRRLKIWCNLGLSQAVWITEETPTSSTKLSEFDELIAERIALHPGRPNVYDELPSYSSPAP